MLQLIYIYPDNTIFLFIKLESFPLKCKIAKIKPLFKKSIKTEVQNHGPLSLLPLGDIKIEGDRKIK